MITIRKGLMPDGDALATLIFSSAPELLPYLFGSEQAARTYIAQASQRPDGQYSVYRHQVAEQGDDVVGCMTLWDNQLSVLFNQHTLQSLVDLLSEHQVKHLVSINNNIAQVFRPPASNQLCIGHLAVMPIYRGLGVGTKLIAYAIKRAKASSKNQLVLDVDSKNDDAISFYLGLGFEILNSTDFTPTDQCFYRMFYRL